MKRSLGLAATLVVVLSLTACSYTFNHNKYWAEKTLTLSVEHVAGTPVLVDTKNGRIEVVAEPDRSDVSVEAHIQCRGATQQEADERLAAMNLNVSRDAGRRLVVKPVFPARHSGSDGASIYIKIPDASGVDLDTSNGRVVAHGLAGHLVIDTSNGRIKVTDHDGSARVDTSNGRILLTNVHGPVEADTSNGAIELSLAHDQTGPIDLDTSNGSITVEVGQGFDGIVIFDTSNGSVHVDDQTGRVLSSSGSRSKRRITVGEGGQTSRLDTSNGSIHFTIGGSPQRGPG
ncbi:MAG: DUF4097 family beta strand repeat-containing protein [Planctomycetota bacterium]|jgi:hypothetical protein